MKAIIIALVAVSSSSSSSSAFSSSVDTSYEHDSSSSEDYDYYNYNNTPSSSSSSGDLNLDATMEFIESGNRCVGNPSPNGIRRSGSDNGNGPNFAFRLSGEDKCADGRGSLYSYGKFENIRSFEECAEKCVKDSPLELINDSVFRGFDFDCHFEECNCLFDRGSLDNSRNRRAFDRTNRREPGTGTADRNGGPAGRGWYCGTLVGFMESELATSRRALRGATY